MSFLVVEKDDRLRSGVKELLRLMWPQTAVITASTGQKASEIIETRSLKAVLLANNLGDMSALTLLDQLSENRLNGKVPVIGLTTHDAEHDEETAEIWDRATTCLEKPYTVEQLIEKIQRSLAVVMLPLLLL